MISTPTGAPKRLVLIAMVFAVSMMFIDQTIVALAVPRLQTDLHLSPTGTQWIVNGYLLALSAFFALGGKLADVLGHRRMLLIGVIGFAATSALCGATPTSSVAEAWMIVFRVMQGTFAALLFPSALAILVASFPKQERGRALAAFFGITGALTAVGPLAGGYLAEWTWRSIFWINVPVAIIAVVLILRANPAQSPRSARIDKRGAGLVSIGMALTVLGLQQSATWGWEDGRTIGALVAGVLLLAAFVAYELRQHEPLIDLHVFRSRGFAVDNAVLFLMSAVFVPLFFFASIYAQAALGDSATSAGALLLVFFAGFASAAQLGGRILDSRGARPTVVIGCGVAAIGFLMWGRALPQLDFSADWWKLTLAGAGLGMVLGPVSTDALNRAPEGSYGEVTGVTQTVRNFGASLGLAVMGTVFISQTVERVVDTLTRSGVPAGQANRIAHEVTSASAGSAGSAGGGNPSHAIIEAVQRDVAHSTQVVVWIMAGVMAAAFVLATALMPRDHAVAAEDDAGTASEATAVAV